MPLQFGTLWQGPAPVQTTDSPSDISSRAASIRATDANTERQKAETKTYKQQEPLRNAKLLNDIDSEALLHARNEFRTYADDLISKNIRPDGDPDLTVVVPELMRKNPVLGQQWLKERVEDTKDIRERQQSVMKSIVDRLDPDDPASVSRYNDAIRLNYWSKDLPVTNDPAILWEVKNSFKDKSKDKETNQDKIQKILDQRDAQPPGSDAWKAFDLRYRELTTPAQTAKLRKDLTQEEIDRQNSLEVGTRPGKVETVRAIQTAKTWADKQAEQAANKFLGLNRIDPSTGKPYTQDNYMAGIFADRMDTSNSTLDALEASGYNPGELKNAVMSNDALNLLKDPQQRQYAQAMRVFINATLRRESGAAIMASEFDSANKQYFAQPGDDPDTQAQKRQARLDAYAGFAAQAGGALDLIKEEKAKRSNVKPTKWVQDKDGVWKEQK